MADAAMAAQVKEDFLGGKFASHCPGLTQKPSAADCYRAFIESRFNRLPFTPVELTLYAALVGDIAMIGVPLKPSEDEANKLARLKALQFNFQMLVAFYRMSASPRYANAYVDKSLLTSSENRAELDLVLVNEHGIMDLFTKKFRDRLLKEFRDTLSRLKAWPKSPTSDDAIQRMERLGATVFTAAELDLGA